MSGELKKFYERHAWARRWFSPLGGAEAARREAREDRESVEYSSAQYGDRFVLVIGALAVGFIVLGFFLDWI
jgi:hypothetical protein